MSKHFKDDDHLRRGRLSLAVVADMQPHLAESRALVETWARTGALLRRLAARTGIAPEMALAVWNVESGGLPFVPGKPVLRLECHKLWEEWGRSRPEIFDRHFRFGGRGDIAGLPWTNHQYRLHTHGPWRAFHGAQQSEYDAFALARRLAGMEAACRSSSFGGPQILGVNHARLGYSDAVSLYRAFGRSLRAQILGFFDFCMSEGIVPALLSSDWHAFARVYNGPGRADAYAEKINDAYRLAHCITSGDQVALDKEEQALAFDHEGFAAFFDGLGITHFTAREFLFRGRENSMPSNAAYGLNRFPPRELWPNIAPVARALDAFRAEIGKPVTLRGIYRTAAYNVAVGGSPGSEHTRFAAADLKAGNAGGLADWKAVMRRIRDRGAFKGAIGLHEEALHIDARGENIDL